MRYNILLLLFLIGCNSDDISFVPNSSLSDLSSRHLNIVSDRDFSIIFYHGGGGDASEAWSKIFTLKKDSWEKVEIRNGIVEVDTILSNDDADFVIKDIIMRKECRLAEANSFLEKLKKYGLFELVEEGELLKRCHEGNKEFGKKSYIDAGYTVFQIVSGNKVRILKYNYPQYEIQDCPIVKEWSSIVKIEELFEREWYAKMHY